MPALYLFCLVLGGGLLVFSLLAGETDAGELDVDGDGFDLGQEFFSVRSFLYFVAGFGATGFLLETLTAASTLAALFWAVATGLTVATATGVVYGWLKRSESGLVPLSSDHLVGLPARVVLPVTAENRGKVLAVVNGRELELIARLYGSADPACPRGSMVVIVEIEGDTALVTPASFLPNDVE